MLKYEEKIKIHLLKKTMSNMPKWVKNNKTLKCFRCQMQIWCIHAVHKLIDMNRWLLIDLCVYPITFLSHFTLQISLDCKSLNTLRESIKQYHAQNQYTIAKYYHLDMRFQCGNDNFRYFTKGDINTWHWLRKLIRMLIYPY